MVPWWFSSIVLMCFARCAVTRRPSAGGAIWQRTPSLQLMTVPNSESTHTNHMQSKKNTGTLVSNNSIIKRMEKMPYLSKPFYRDPL